MLCTFTLEIPGISSPIIASLDTEILPLITQLTSKVVPPMSKTTAFFSFKSLIAYFLPETGAIDGPESTEYNGLSTISAVLITPPAELSIPTFPIKPSLFNLLFKLFA